MASDNQIDARDHWLLTGIPDDVVGPLLQAGEEVRYVPGDVIFREGEPSEGLYLVTAGAARVTVTGESGETFLATVRSNEVLGEMGVLDGEPRSGTATALTLCAAFHVPAEAFLDLLERSPLASMRLLALLCQRLRRANGRLVELPSTSAVNQEDVPVSS
jgi:CRP-like cAMP-binding protein